MAYSGNIVEYLGCDLAANRPVSLNLTPGALGIFHAYDTDELWLWADGGWISRGSGGSGIPDAPSDGKLYGRKDAAWEEVPAGGGSGDVTGPAGSANNRIAVFDGATGKIIKDGGVTISELVAQARTAPENVQTGTAYTLVLADAFKMVCMDNALSNTVTVPANSDVAFPLGTRVDLSQDGAGQTTIAAASGVTIRTPETLKLRKQWAKATLIKRAADTWDLEGGLEAAP